MLAGWLAEFHRPDAKKQKKETGDPLKEKAANPVPAPSGGSQPSGVSGGSGGSGGLRNRLEEPPCTALWHLGELTLELDGAITGNKKVPPNTVLMTMLAGTASPKEAPKVTGEMLSRLLNYFKFQWPSGVACLSLLHPHFEVACPSPLFCGGMPLPIV